jgi:hypothetical protein
LFGDSAHFKRDVGSAALPRLSRFQAHIKRELKMSNTNLHIALNYAKRGWAVLPVYGIKNGRCQCAKGKACTRPGKHPITKNGVKDATTNLKLIKKWWKASPTANIAIATGTKSGLLVLDLDPRNGGNETLKAAQKKYGTLPTTVTAITGGDGKHFIFVHPNESVRSDTAGKLFGRGLDVLSGGHYFVAPGSVGLKRKYVWVTGKTKTDLDPAELPKAWVSRLRLGKDDGAAKKAPAAAGAEIAEGGRNTTLTSMAGTMRRAGGALEGLARLRQRGTGFQLPSDVKAANAKFMIDANPLPSFIEERCVLDIKAGIYLADFYRSFQVWCEDSGITMKQQRNKVRKNLSNLKYKFGHGNKGSKVMGLRFK